MELADVTYIGPPVDDPELMAELPLDLAAELRRANGLVAFRGGLHVRGVCSAPSWHSLRAAWRGPESLAARYPTVGSGDVPFAQDALGDQFLQRQGKVIRLAGETGKVEPLGATLAQFLKAAAEDPVGYLGLQPLLQFEAAGGRLTPGELLSSYPPFCTKESARGVSLRAVPVADRLGFLASLAAQLAPLANGAPMTLKVVP